MFTHSSVMLVLLKGEDVVLFYVFYVARATCPCRHIHDVFIQ